MNEDQSRKVRMSRALSAIERCREMGIDPSTMTDRQLIDRVWNLGKRTIPTLRKLLHGDRPLCPHCGRPVDALIAQDNSLQQVVGDSRCH